MIPNFKQSCIKYNLDFDKPYNNHREFLNDFGSICRFCNVVLTTDFLLDNYFYVVYVGCLKCEYEISLNRWWSIDYSLRLSNILYKNHRIYKSNNIIAKNFNSIIINLPTDFQTLLNKINMFKPNDSKL